MFVCLNAYFHLHALKSSCIINDHVKDHLNIHVNVHLNVYSVYQNIRLNGKKLQFILMNPLMSIHLFVLVNLFI